MESSCVDRERCRRSCGGERHTRQGDQPCGRRAASGCAAQASKIERSSLIESVADAAAVSSVTPDRATSGAVTEQRAACPAQASESEISSVDRERCRRSCGGECYTRQGGQRGRYRAASGLCSFSFRQGDRRCRHRAAKTPSIERPVPPKLSARAAALMESVADAAAASSVTSDRAISGAHAEQRAACAAQAFESESSSVDRERCRRSCGGERHTQRGDHRCTRRAASGCAAQASESESSSVD